MDSAELLERQLGSFTLTRLLGAGGMGAVYLGENKQIESRVAIKVLHPMFAANQEMVQRFWDEARAANRIGHPGIVRIHDCARDPELGTYMIMEFLEGQTLEDRLRLEGRLSPLCTARLLQQAAAALYAAHQAGVIHRDLKTGNMFLSKDPEIPGGERVRILDFGIAKLHRQGQAMGQATMTGAIFGSPLFMSPEQCLSAKNVDERADIYSLGVVAYQCLTNRYPFNAETFGELVKLQQTTTPAPIRSIAPETPQAMATVVEQALSIDPARRPASMEVFRRAMLEVLGTVSQAPSLALAGTSLAPTPATDPSLDETLAPPALRGGLSTTASSAGEKSSPPPPAPMAQSVDAQMTAQAPRSRGVPWPVVAGGAMILAIVGVLALVFVSDRGRQTSTENPSEPTATLSTASALAPPTAPAAQPSTRPVSAPSPAANIVAQPDGSRVNPVADRVQVRLDLKPAHAEVMLDGELRRDNPLLLDRSTSPRRLELRARGYLSEVSVLVPDGDKTLVRELRRLRSSSSEHPRPPASGSKASTRPDAGRTAAPPSTAPLR